MEKRVFKTDRREVGFYLLLSLLMWLFCVLMMIVFADEGMVWQMLLASLLAIIASLAIWNLWRSFSYEIVLLDQGVLFKVEQQFYFDWHEIFAFTLTEFRIKLVHKRLLHVHTRGELVRLLQSRPKRWRNLTTNSRIRTVDLSLFKDPPEIIVGSLRERLDAAVERQGAMPPGSSLPSKPNYGGFYGTYCSACGHERQPSDTGPKHRCPKCRDPYIVSNPKYR